MGNGEGVKSIHKMDKGQVIFRPLHHVQSFTLIKLILIFFFLLQNIRVWLTLATGNGFFGALVDEAMIIGLVLFYITYSLGVWKIDVLCFDRVKFFLLSILAIAFLQSSYYMVVVPGEVEARLFVAGYSFKKMFFPLTLFFIFSYLIRRELIKNGEMFIKQLIRFFGILLWVMILFNILEASLRTVIPAFNLYFNQYVLNRSLSLGLTHYIDDYPVSILMQMVGIYIKRVHGICLEMYLSGAMIFLLYLFHVFISGKFRVFSMLNGVVFIALLVSGSRTTILPFLVLNVVFFIRQHVGRTFFSPILISMVLAGVVSLTIPLMKAAFSYEGFFVYAGIALKQLLQHWEMFIFGIGPVSHSPWGGVIGGSFFTIFHSMEAVGPISIMLEAGLLMSTLFLGFHIFVFRKTRNKSGVSQPHDKYIKGLKIMIVLYMLIGVAHWPVLFHPTMLVFHVFLIALLYNLAQFGITGFVVVSGNSLSFQTLDRKRIPQKP